MTDTNAAVLAEETDSTEEVTTTRDFEAITAQAVLVAEERTRPAVERLAEVAEREEAVHEAIRAARVEQANHKHARRKLVAAMDAQTMRGMILKIELGEPGVISSHDARQLAEEIETKRMEFSAAIEANDIEDAFLTRQVAGLIKDLDRLGAEGTVLRGVHGDAAYGTGLFEEGTTTFRVDEDGDEIPEGFYAPGECAAGECSKDEAAEAAA